MLPEIRAQIDFNDPLALPGGMRFESFDRIIAAQQPEAVRPCLEEVEKTCLKEHCWAVGFLAYEAASGLDPCLKTQASNGTLPLLWFGISRRPPRPSPPPDETTLSQAMPQIKWQPLITPKAYAQAFKQVKNYIYHGLTYQVNLTFPMEAAWTMRGAALYHQLCRAQQGNWSAWLQTPDWEILSVSPELFFRLENGIISTRPMKGTRPRGVTTAEDRHLAAELHSDPKERAENVMIVDLLRNDLGRIAKPGSVRVPQLFQTEKYPTVWQMTSCVEAEVMPNLPLVELMKALFPCGSVTGAPKIKTMELIAAEEAHPRGVYCGAVGFIRPDGNMVFNVAIRTLTIANGNARYPVGGGLVADSAVDSEYQECLTKAAVLTRPAKKEFQLLETLRFEPGTGFFLLDRHLARLADSAIYFNFPCDTLAIRADLRDVATEWTTPRRVRLLLHRAGHWKIEHVPYTPEPPATIRRLAVAAVPVQSRNPFLYHKTTHREMYQRAAARCPSDADDVCLINERGEITETTIANLAIERNGVWLTPPLSSGLLPGTLRAERLARRELQEAILTVEDLRTAENIQVFNSLRGILPAVLI